MINLPLKNCIYVWAPNTSFYYYLALIQNVNIDSQVADTQKKKNLGKCQAAMEEALKRALWLWPAYNLQLDARNMRLAVTHIFITWITIFFVFFARVSRLRDCCVCTQFGLCVCVLRHVTALYGEKRNEWNVKSWWWWCHESSNAGFYNLSALAWFFSCKWCLVSMMMMLVIFLGVWSSLSSLFLRESRKKKNMVFFTGTKWWRETGRSEENVYAWKSVWNRNVPINLTPLRR